MASQLPDVQRSAAYTCAPSASSLGKLAINHNIGNASLYVNPMPLYHNLSDQHTASAAEKEGSILDPLIDNGTTVQLLNRASTWQQVQQQIPARTRRIVSATSRQMAFCKRRTSLAKKAHELSILCDAQVALVVFSSTGKLFEYASTNMPLILERYWRCTAPTHINGHTTRDLEYWRHEAKECQEKIECLEQRERTLMGEFLWGLPIKDLQSIENQLQGALSRVRTRKTQLLISQLEGLHKREFALLQENAFLKNKVAAFLPTKEKHPFYVRRSEAFHSTMNDIRSLRQI